MRFILSGSYAGFPKEGLIWGKVDISLRGASYFGKSEPFFTIPYEALIWLMRGGGLQTPKTPSGYGPVNISRHIESSSIDI